MLEREKLQDKKRIVIKIGSSSLTHAVSGDLNLQKIEKLVRIISDLKGQGKEVVLVSSGAIATGRQALHHPGKPESLAQKQAFAAVGQARLMMVYQRLFAEYNQVAAQVLMTKDTMTNDASRSNARNTFDELLKLGAVPVVNENDTVSIDELELEMGENDSLAANVAVLANADLLIIMSDIEGLFDKDPHKYDDAELIPVVPEITEEIKAIAGGAGSSLGTGGMATKIKAAEICKNGGIDLIIMNGRDPRHLYKVFENKPIGTLFTANGEV